MNDLLKLKKGPIASNSEKNVSHAENAVSGNNGIINRAIDNIVNAGNVNSNSGNVSNPVPVPLQSNLPANNANKNSSGNGIIGRFINDNNLTLADNSFMNSYNKIISDAIAKGREKRNSQNNGITTPQSDSPTSPITHGSPVQKAPEVVQVRSYVSPYSQFPLTYDSDLGKVYLGGREVPIAHISEDGRSYAKKKDLDALLNELRYSDPNSKDAIIQRVMDSGKDIYDAVDKLKRRDKFSYDYRTDPVYKAYERQYDAMRDDAIREAISSNVARTGGMMNSNAASVAHQTAAEYDRMKANIIPTLEGQAYQRYANENQLNSEAAAAIGNMVNSYMGNMASLYGQQDSRDYSKYAFDKELAESGRIADNENDRLWAGMTAEDNRWYAEYLNDLKRLGLTERELDFNEWYNTMLLGIKSKNSGSKSVSSSKNNAGTGVPIG